MSSPHSKKDFSKMNNSNLQGLKNSIFFKTDHGVKLPKTLRPHILETYGAKRS